MTTYVANQFNINSKKVDLKEFTVLEEVNQADSISAFLIFSTYQNVLMNCTIITQLDNSVTHGDVTHRSRFENFEHNFLSLEIFFLKLHVEKLGYLILKQIFDCDIRVLGIDININLILSV